MLNKLFNNQLVKRYLNLPLWSKIAIPVGAFLIVSWILAPLFKLALMVALAGVAAYFFLNMKGVK